MGSTRRSFTEEYKAQAVAFVVDEGRPVAEVARNIGVHEMTLIAEEYGPEQAASQLGHSDDGTIARKHYIDKPHEVPTSRQLWTGSRADSVSSDRIQKKMTSVSAGHKWSLGESNP
ncbi:transposase [Nocardia sp. NPDC050710]|uniref:transposase n=1 Tax=Nocardia sp. NPDC050710 TaxID=3157220 RepID=UPI0033E429BA